MLSAEKIGLLIGPGGKTIRAIQEESKTTLDVGEDGTITIAGMNAACLEAAIARIEALTAEIKVGRVYTGKVCAIKDFGAFIEIAPGKDGLCHISELAEGYVRSVTDVCNVGDKLEVKVIAVDDQNRVKLSRKAVLLAAKPVESAVVESDEEEDDEDDDDLDDDDDDDDDIDEDDDI